MIKEEKEIIYKLQSKGFEIYKDNSTEKFLISKHVCNCGRGWFTTAITAVNLDRIGIGIELGKKDFETAILKNIKKHQNTLFGKKIKIDKINFLKEKKLNRQL